MVRKGEIACYKQFLLSHNVFHSYRSLVHQNAAFCGNGNGLNLFSLITNQTMAITKGD